MNDTKRTRELANMILPPHVGVGWRSKEVREAAESLRSLANEVDELRRDARRWKNALRESNQEEVTAGVAGEKPLYESIENGIEVRRMPEDPLAIRISIGKAHDLEDARPYAVFRGKPSEVIALLEEALHAVVKSHMREDGHLWTSTRKSGDDVIE